MTLVIAFAKTDLMAVNVIGVKQDSQATNVMNVNLISLVMTVINASQIISIIHCVKVCLNKSYFQKKILYNFSIAECECNSDGSTSLDCDEDYGTCSCKEGFDGLKCHKCMPNVIGDKCDTCQTGFFGYPSCQEGLSIIRSLSLYHIVALNIICDFLRHIIYTLWRATF